MNALWIIGDGAGRKKFMMDRIAKWIQDIQWLSSFPGTQPQASYAAVAKSLQCE